MKKYRALTLLAIFVSTLAFLVNIPAVVAVDCSSDRDCGGEFGSCSGGTCLTTSGNLPGIGSQCATDRECQGGRSCIGGNCVDPSAVSAPTSTTGQPTPPFQPKKLDNPLVVDSIEALIGRLIRLFVGISGTAGLLMFVYGGILWITAAGDAQKIDKGKKIFTWATIGLVLIFAAYAIVNALFQIVRPQ